MTNNPDHKKPSARTGKDIFNLVRSKKNDIAATNNAKPEGEIQHALVAIWSALLNSNEFTVNDDFFKAGGNSIKAVQLASQVARQFGVFIELTDIFLNTSIVSQAGLVEEKKKLSALDNGIRSLARPQHIPLSFSQERLWFIEELEGTVQYHIPLLFKLSGPVNENLFGQAFRMIVNRHEILRTVIVVHEGQPAQQVLQTDLWSLSKIDATSNDASREKYITEEIIRPFDLSKDHMLRASIIKAGDDTNFLLIVLHHLAADGWSMSLIIDEFTEVYTALLEGRSPALPTLPIQYADFAIWQKEETLKEGTDTGLQYWKNKLTAVQPLDLPSDYSRPPQRTTSGGNVNFSIDKELLNQLHELSRAHGSTLFMTLLAAFKILLHKYTGQQDIVVGTPVANRGQQETQNLIGLFVNTIALRTQVDPLQTFGDLLYNLIPATIEAYQHQDVPFEKVVEATVQQRDLSRSPLVQIMFVLQNGPQSKPLQLQGLDVVLQPLNQSISKFDLSFNLNETVDGLSGSIEYSTDLFSQARIERMITHYQALLASILQSKTTTINRLSILSAAETQQILFDFNNTGNADAHTESVVELFERQCIKNGNALALVYNNEEVTFSRLNTMANQLAHLLVQKGVRPGSLVPLCFDNSIQMVVAVLGILKAGCGYVPLKPGIPANRLQHIIHDTGADLIVSSNAYSASLIPSSQVTIIAVDEVGAVYSTMPDSNLKLAIPLHNTAYVIFTSGSTGTPKGVLISHQNLLSYLVNSKTNYIAGDDSISGTFMHLSYTFDASVTALFMPLINGQSIVISTSENYNAFDDANFDKHAPYSFIKLTPAHLPFFQNKVSANKKLATKKLVVGGEALYYKHLEHFVNEGIAVEVINEYGPTEATVGCSTYHLYTDATLENGQQSISIGKPIDNVKLFVVNGESLAPIGVPGEIYIAGAGLSQGYLNNRALTDQKFVNNFLDLESTTKLYKTGDIGFYTADGNLQYLGRKDDQVKIRGYRIEPGEIENILLQNEAISQVAVVPKAINGEYQLAAYFVADDTIDIQQAKAFLAERVPEYMVPFYWMQLESFPLTVNGKIDKRSLPDIDATGIPQLTYKAPQNQIQQTLVDLWQQLLGNANIGITDNFFVIGGHSLLAMRFVIAVRKQLNIELSLKDFFLHPTVEEIEGVITGTTHHTTLPSLIKAERPAFIPLSFSQSRLWFLHQLQGTQSYHLPAALQLNGALNIDALENAIRSVIDRHEVLRTVFREKDGKPYQLVNTADNWKLERIVDTGLSNKKNLDKYIAKRVEKPFDLARDFMLRADVIQLSDTGNLLLITMHHIASDGWSIRLFIEDLLAYYKSFAAEETLVIAPLKFQYADYAIWQDQYFSKEVMRLRLQFWIDRLQHVTPLQLPTDFTRPAVQSLRGANLQYTIDGALVKDINDLGSTHGTTLFMTLLAAFKVLLYRYSGQQDICVGTSVANRQLGEVEDLIGFFINNIALRSTLNGADTFVQLLQQVKETVINAYDYQDVPFERVVDAVVTERDTSRNPLFQVMFVLQNTPEQPEIKLDALDITPYAIEQKYSQLDMIINVQLVNGNLAFSIDYCTDLFKPDTIMRMMENFKTSLQSIVQNADQSLDTLEIVSIGERQQLLHDFNRTAGPKNTNDTVVDLFRKQVQKAPSTIAIKYKDQSLTYTTLDQLSNRLATQLVNRGVNPGDNILLCINKGFNMMVAIWGILKAGAVYVPVDPGYPADRKNFMLSDTGARLVICDNQSEDSFDGIANVSLLNIDGLHLSEDGVGDKDLVSLANPSGIAYIIYTSGSTGKPKGVTISHASLVHYLVNAKTNYIDANSNRAGSYLHLSFTFDASITALFMPLLFGKSIVISATEGVNVFEDENFLANAPYDFLKITPAHLELLKSLDVDTDAEPWIANKLVIGGEALYPGQFTYFYNHDIEVEVINEYGPTEATVGCIVFSFKTVRDHHSIQNGILIGRPIDNTNIYIVDKANNVVPIGASGEICIAGDGLSLGYVNRDTLNAEKFVNSIFHGYKITRVYKTGDYGRWLANGNIEYIGRQDDQVKIRGYRVELGEIENAILRGSSVDQVTVIAKSDKENNKRLIAYVVYKAGADIEEVKAYTRTLLPDYMQPSMWVAIDEMPLTISGKIDKKALPEPTDALLQTAEVSTGELTDLQQVIADIWKDLLEIDTVGLHDNFFAMGGDSLLGVRVIAAIRKKLSIDIEINAIFDHSTIFTLSEFIDNKDQQNNTPSIVPTVRPAKIPLSYSQERLWFINQLEGTAQYHISTILQLVGAIDVKAMQYAFKSVVKRHEVLRTVIKSEDGIPYQLVNTSGAFQMQTEQISPEDNNEIHLQTLVNTLVTQPFNLEEDYMARVKLIGINDNEHLLVITFHHIAFDGISNTIFIKEFIALYENFVKNHPPGLQPLHVQYADYALWQRAYLTGEVLDQKLNFWKQNLAGLEPLELPTDFLRPSLQSFKGSVASFSFDKKLLKGLKELSSKEDVTLFMTSLAAFYVLLSKYTAQNDISIGTPVGNRSQHEIEQLIGFFTNTVVLRAKLDDGQSFNSFLRSVKEQSLAAFQHQDVPFEKVVDAVIQTRDVSRSPLFQVMFVFQNEAVYQPTSIGDVKIITKDYPYQTSKFDLTFFLKETDDGLEGFVEYATDLFRPETIKNLIAHYGVLLDQVAADGAKNLADLSILSPNEEQQLLQSSAGDKAAIEYDTIGQLFEAQVAATPQNTALVFNQQKLTYHQLNERANQVAHYLRSRGVKAETLVPVCLDRSVEMLTAILGIIKAGGAYVPIDPQYPFERIQYMLQDTGATLMIGDANFLQRANSVETEVAGQSVAKPTWNAEVILIDEQQDHINTQPTSDLTRLANAHNLAYIIYTSGSTGKPKGVMIEHKSVLNLIAYQVKKFGITPDEKILQFSNYAFDASVEQILLAFSTGAALVLIDKEKLTDQTALIKLIEQEQVTHLHATPSYLETLPPAKFGHLKRVVAGGEQCALILAEKWGRHVDFYNEYGPTETTVTIIEYKYSPNLSTGILPIGTALANTSIYIVNKQGKLQPKGLIGEIYIGGESLARGYLNLPQLTAEKFIANPFDTSEQSKVYRTGDFGKINADGLIEYLGRIDEQVKVRGYRIELGEIEHAILQSGLVNQAVVAAPNEVGGNKVLAAYVVCEAAMDKTALTSYLAASLPAYMLPAFWIQVKELPLTSNGKIDKKALPPIDSSAALKQYVAPVTEMQQALASIWQDLLGIERVGIEDNFFELGGDSILTIQVVSRAGRQGYRLQPRDIFTHQTIGRITNATTSNGHQTINAEQGVLTGQAGLLPIQQWYLDSNPTDVSWFNQSVLLSIDKSISSAQLKTVFNTLLQQHDALRFSYQQIEGEWQQEYGSKGIDIATEDLSTATDPHAAISTIATTYQQQLSIEKGELLRVVHFSMGGDEQKNRLLIIVHHLAIDGVSWRILLEDIELLITAATEKRDLTLPQKTSSYRQWHQALLAYSKTNKLLSQVNYWSRMSDQQGYLPVDFPGNQARVQDLENININVDATTTRQLLQQVSPAYRTNVNDVLLAALSLTINDQFNVAKLLIGLEGHGREDLSQNVDVSRTVGWFTSLYPLLLNVGDGQEIGTTIKLVKEQLRAVPDKGLGYGVLKYLNQHEQLQSDAPFDIIFNYFGQLDNVLGSSKWLTTAPEQAGQNRSDQLVLAEKMSISAQVLDGELQMSWTYSSRQYKAETIQRLANAYVDQLNAVIQHCLYQLESKHVTYTPSDFNLNKDVSVPAFDTFLQMPVDGLPLVHQFESVYKMSGLQQGMLFHSLYNPADEAYIEQFSCLLQNVKPDLFTASWQQLFARHTILRTAFFADALSIPVQCVMKQIQVPLSVVDLTHLSETEQAEAISNFEVEDRRRGFDLAQAPLMRLTLLKVNEGDRMVWTYHHLLSDGWSMPILLQEFLQTYDDLINTGKTVTATVDHYEDYIRYIDDRDKDAEEVYWKSYLSQFTEPTLLPFIPATVNRTKSTGDYKVVDLHLDQQFSADLQQYVKQKHITINTLMQGVWAYLLHQYTGNSNITYGIIVSGRPDDLANVEQRVGLYINTLPLHSSINAYDRVDVWLQALQQEQAASAQYQYTSLATIQSWAGVEGELFDSILIFENYPVGELLSSTNWLLKASDVRVSEQTNYPLNIVIQSAGHVHVSFQYNSTLLPDDYAQAISRHFNQVLHQVVNGVDEIADLNVLDQQQRAVVLNNSQGSILNYADEAGLCYFFSRQVQNTPNNIALIFNDERYTYQQLNDYTNQVAHYLRAHGVTAETLVPVCLNRGIELMVAIIAINKAGGAYVPIDPAYPTERIKYILDDTQATLVVSSKEIIAQWKSTNAQLVETQIGHANTLPKVEWITIGKDEFHIAEQPINDLSTIARAENLAYVIYTSGSTGTPKGVLVENQSVMNLALYQVKAFGITQEEKILQFSNVTFDASVEQILLAFATGASLVLADSATISDPGLLLSLIEKEKVTHLHATPSFLETLTPAKYGDLKRVIAGGEQCALSLAEAWGKHVDFYNEYGPTETTVTIIEYKYNSLKTQGVLPIGKPLSNTAVYLVDKSGQLVDDGMTGEIWIGGKSVARGYLNRPELTAEKFIADPFSNTIGARVYRTGDFARRNLYGDLEYLGRIDEQVKIRGYRIELGEIENVLLQHEGVQQAVVLTAGLNNQTSDTLVAYVVSAGAFDADELSAFLLSKLPAYMVPSRWKEVDQIPLTVNGKVDRKALPAPVDAHEMRKSFVAPRNTTETALANIWKELLGNESPGVHQNFFQSGGHSLLAIRLMGAIRRTFNVAISIKEIFSTPTIAGLAEFVTKAAHKTGLPPIEIIESKPAQIPLSFSQERLYFIDRFEGTSQYHLPLAIRINKGLNIDALNKALQTLIAHHQVLRSVVAEDKGTPYQTILPASGWAMKLVDAVHFSKQDLHDYLALEASLPFDLAKDFMLRASLLSMVDGEYVLLLVLHHIAVDGWSMPILLKEFEAIYNSFDKPEHKQYNAIQYADFAIWQRRYFTGQYLQQKIDYWKQKLQDVAPLDLPTDFNRPAILSGNGARSQFFISQQVLDGLRKIGAGSDATLNMLLLSAFKVLLYRYTSQQDICVGIPVANREQPELENMVGFFVNTLAIRSELNGSMSFTDLLQQLKNTTLEAFENQELPFEKVVEQVIKNRDQSRTPVFQVMFALQNEHDQQNIQLNDAEIELLQVHNQSAKFELTVNLSPTATGIDGTIEYSTDLFTQQRIEAMMVHYVELIKSIISKPDDAIISLDMLTPGETDVLLHTFNQPIRVPQEPQTFVAMFRQSVADRKTSIALVDGEITMTYEELDLQSDQLANHLVGKGVSVEMLVPVCMERSIGLIVAMVAIMKAGTAYVPIDLAYPEQRKMYMLHDTEAKVVITNKSSAHTIPVNSQYEIIILEDALAEETKQDQLQSIHTGTSNLAYVIYTSGSTGKPKGVMVENHSLSNLILWHNDAYQVTAQSQSTAMAGIAFDAFAWEIFPYLSAGSTIHVFGPSQAATTHNLVAYFEANSITHSFLATALVPDFVHNTKNKLTSLTYLLTGGDKLPAIDLQQVNYQLINNYGPTENTVVATNYVLLQSDVHQVPSIGAPIKNTQLYILNEVNGLMPVGVPGEICLGGVQVARGYWNNATLTAEKFVFNPYGAAPYNVLYKTGDKGRYLPDGNVEYLGRMDDQIKLRGYRIELGEIEHEILQWKTIKQAIVVLKEYSALEKRLVGYVVTNSPFDPAEMKAFLANRLPEYMVPALWVTLDKLPLTVNGKIDKAALPAVALDEMSSVEFVPAETPMELLLTEMWQDLLGVSRIGVHDNFFELGGHSLLALRLIANIQGKLAIDLAVKEVFEFSTIAELSRFLDVKTAGTTNNVTDEYDEMVI